VTFQGGGALPTEPPTRNPTGGLPSPRPHVPPYLQILAHTVAVLPNDDDEDIKSKSIYQTHCGPSVETMSLRPFSRNCPGPASSPAVINNSTFCHSDHTVFQPRIDVATLAFPHFR